MNMNQQQGGWWAQGNQNQGQPQQQLHQRALEIHMKYYEHQYRHRQLYEEAMMLHELHRRSVLMANWHHPASSSSSVPYQQQQQRQQQQQHQKHHTSRQHGEHQHWYHHHTSGNSIALARGGTVTYGPEYELAKDEEPLPPSGYNHHPQRPLTIEKNTPLGVRRSAFNKSNVDDFGEERLSFGARFAWVPEAIELLQDLVNRVDINAEIHIVGSVGYDLGDAFSDLDVVILSELKDSRAFLLELQEHASQLVGKKMKQQGIVPGKIPVLVLEVPRGRIDVCLNQTHPIGHKKFMRRVIETMPWMKAILLFVKRWLRVRNIPLTNKGGIPQIAFLLIAIQACYKSGDVYSFFELLAEDCNWQIEFKEAFTDFLEVKAGAPQELWRRKTENGRLIIIDPCSNYGSEEGSTMSDLGADVPPATLLLYKAECKRVLMQFTAADPSSVDDDVHTPCPAPPMLPLVAPEDIVSHCCTCYGQQNMDGMMNKEAGFNGAAAVKRASWVKNRDMNSDMMNKEYARRSWRVTTRSKLDVQKMWLAGTLDDERNKKRCNESANQWSLYLIDGRMWIGASIKTRHARKDNQSFCMVGLAVLIGNGIIFPLPKTETNVSPSFLIQELECKGLRVLPECMELLKVMGYEEENARNMLDHEQQFMILDDDDKPAPEIEEEKKSREDSNESTEEETDEALSRENSKGTGTTKDTI